MGRTIIDVRLLAKGGTSGIEEYTRLLVSALLSRDKTNKYFLFYNGFKKNQLLAFADFDNAEVVERFIPNKLFDLSNRVINWPKVELFAKGDLVFSPHFNLLSTDLPRVITFHDLSFVHHPDFFLGRQRFWHWLQNCRKQALRAEKIIAVSEFTKQDLVDFFGIKEEKIKVVYSGVDPIFKKLLPHDSGLAEFKKRHGFNQLYMLYLGTVEPRKNVLSIIKVFNALKEKNAFFKDWELVLAGNLGWLYKDVLKEAAKSRHSSQIRFLGGVSSADRLYLYNAAQVFLYPSFFEGFGFPPLEAQACGVPVVASNRTSLPEILKESAVLVDPWKLDEIYQAISKILTDEVFAKDLVSRGFENARQFNWDKAAGETMEVLYS